MSENHRIISALKIGATVFGIALATISAFLLGEWEKIALAWIISLGVPAVWWTAGWLYTKRKSRLQVQAETLARAEKRTRELEDARAVALAQAEKLRMELAEARERAQLQSKFCIRYVGDLNAEEGRDFLVEKRLEDLRTGKVSKIEIVARTAFCWLGGDEKQGPIDSDKFKTSHEKLVSHLMRTLEETSGEISLVIQNPDVGGPSFNSEWNTELREHGEYVIRSFSEISKLLRKARAKGTISLRITDVMIVNSMVLSTSSNGGRRTLTFDLESSFRYVPTKSKPFLVFDGIGENAHELLELFEGITRGSISLEDFEKRVDAIKRIEREIANHSKFFSVLRQDHSKRLAYTAARSFLSEKTEGRVLPPACVQFLVTNRCTTNCVMCGHHKIGVNEPDPTQEQVKATLKSIQHLGTRAVVISGGEPLIRTDLPDILRYGKSSCRLNLGLLTNGVSSGGEAANEDAVDAIVETCDWVQVSIDSFDTQVYNTIRKGAYLVAAKASLKRLREKQKERRKDKNGAVSLKHIELCYTIQKANIGHLDNDIETMMKELDEEISIRLKIAHGPKNGEDFLLEERKNHVTLLKRILHKHAGKHRVNAGYLLDMIENNYFHESDIYAGTPIKKTMKGELHWEGYERKGYVCHILRHSCLIDAKGDLYPCCFLFDDNHGRSSTLRTRYNIQEPVPGQMPKALPTSSNLAARWYAGECLNSYREKTVPIDEEACWYCTRHFYQNELLNEVYGLFKKYEDCGLAAEFVRRCEKDPEIKEPFWL